MNKLETKLYRIVWTAKNTGATGQGTACFKKEVAQKIADELNIALGKYNIYHRSGP